MYIDKKSMPESIKDIIKVKELEKLLTEAKEEYNTFSYTLNYNNQYLIDVEITYEWHKTKGMKWEVIGARYIYLIDEKEGKRYSYAI